MKKMLPIGVVLLALAGLAVCGGFMWAVLTGRLGEKTRTPHQDCRTAVVLDDGWVEALLRCGDRDGLETYLRKTIAEVKRLGGNTLLLHGMTPAGEALFADSTKALERPAEVKAWDGLWNPCDPLKLLIKLAGREELEVCLLAGQEGAAPWQQTLAAQYDLRVATEECFYTLEELPGTAARSKKNGAFREVILGSYTALEADDTTARLYTLFAMGEDPDLTALEGGRTIAQTLAVTYPTKNKAKIYTKKLFLMGTSDPGEELTLNGSPVQRNNTKGVWGVLVELSYGENCFTLKNGEDTLEYTVERPKPAAGGGSAKPKPDSSRPAQSGQRLQVTDAIASALSDPAQSGSISQTLYRGAVAEVVESRQYNTGSALSYAYRLSTGDWVRSAVCQLITAQNATFTVPELYEDEASRCTVLRFTGGTPAVFHEWEEGVLRLRFLSTDYTAGEFTPAGDFLTGYEAAANGGELEVTLRFAEDEPLYGWAVNYDTEANETTVWLKRRPRLSNDPLAPLAGVTVLLDAGHGGSDDGAMGAAGMSAPLEKDVNLCSAAAAKHRLEQLGAAVLMMREGDTFPTLGDRVTALNEWHPDFFISCHHNSIELTVDVNSSSGTEAYWFYDEGQALAARLVETVCAAAGRKNRGEHYGYYYVTRSNICPAVLLELGFVTNPSEYVACADAEAYWAEGGAIAQTVYEQVRANTVQ